MAGTLKQEILLAFEELEKIPPDVRLAQRSDKFARMGRYAAIP